MCIECPNFLHPTAQVVCSGGRTNDQTNFLLYIFCLSRPEKFKKSIGILENEHQYLRETAFLKISSQHKLVYRQNRCGLVERLIKTMTCVTDV